MKGKINCLQYSTIMIIILVSSFMGIGVYSLVKAAGVDAYLSILLAAIIGIPVLLLFLYINSYEPDLSLPLKLEKLYGKKLGKVFTFFCSLFIFIFANNYMFNLTNFIVSQFLPETPLLVIGIVFAFLAAYANLQGLETLSRLSLILLFINIALFGIGIFGLIPSFEFDNLKPFLEFGIARPLKATFYVNTLSIFTIFSLLIIPKNKMVDSKNFNRAVVISYLIGLFFIFTFCIITLGILGIHLASIYQYPEYIILKHVNLFGFLDRIENIITATWIFGLFISITFAIYYVSTCIAPKKEKKNIPIILVTLALLFSVHIIPNNTSFNSYIYYVAPFLKMIYFCIFIIIGITIFIKKRKKNNN